MNRPSASIKRTAPGSGSSRVLNIGATGSGFSSPDDLCKTLLPLLLLLCISRQSNIFKLRQHLFQCLLNTALQTGTSNHTDPIQHIPLRQISVTEDKLLPAVLCNQHRIIVNICMAGLPRHFHRPSAIGTFILFGAAVYQGAPDLTVLIKSRQRTFSYGSAFFTIKEHAFQGGLNRLPQPFSGWNLVAGETGKPLLMQFPYWGVYNGHQLHFPDSQYPAPGQFLSSPVSGEGSPSAGAAAPSSSVSCGWKKISMMLLSPPGG